MMAMSNYPTTSDQMQSAIPYPLAGQGTAAQLPSMGPVNVSDTEPQSTGTADQPNTMLGPNFQNPWAAGERPGARGPMDYPG